MKTTRHQLEFVLGAFEADLPRMLESTREEEHMEKFATLAAEISESAAQEDRDYVWERLRHMRIDVIRGARAPAKPAAVAATRRSDASRAAPDPEPA
ncbi:MAG: hypothetical protein ABWY48_11025 [Pseudoxanthomonas sp.]